jgi:hypothetical protein
MTENERNLLEKQFASASCYFEYGSGASTKRAVEFKNITSIVCVESDRAFFDNEVLPDSGVGEAVAHGRLQCLLVDIGPTKRWGYPRDRRSIGKWPNYPRAILSTEENWDLVLIDGRFRVACMAAALLKCPSAKILVHDFWRRKRYQVMFDYCDVVEAADELVLLSKKKACSDDDLKQLLERYQTIPSDKTFWFLVQDKLGVKV